jgi:hypothetical protein
MFENYNSSTESNSGRSVKRLVGAVALGMALVACVFCIVLVFSHLKGVTAYQAKAKSGWHAVRRTESPALFHQVLTSYAGMAGVFGFGSVVALLLCRRLNQDF